MKEETVLDNDDQTQENGIANAKEYAEIKDEETLEVMIKDEEEYTEAIKKEETLSDPELEKDESKTRKSLSLKDALRVTRNPDFICEYGYDIQEPKDMSRCYWKDKSDKKYHCKICNCMHCSSYSRQFSVSALQRISFAMI